MKKTGFLFICLFIMCHPVLAENLSINDDYFVSKPTLSSNGTVLRQPGLNNTYNSLDISFSIEKNRSDAYGAKISTAAAVYEGKSLKGVTVSEKVLSNNETDFCLSLDNVLLKNADSKIKILVWDNMKPVTNTYEISPVSNPLTVENYDMKIIRERVEKDSALYSTTANPSSLLAKLGADGKFTDIDYSYTSEKSTWEPSAVFENVITMCKAYFSPGNSYYMDAGLKTAIDNVLNDWVKNKYTSVNWWFNEIDVPQKLSQILLYPFDENESYLPGLKTLALKGMPVINESKIHKASDTGGNLTDKLQIAVKIAAATRDADSMKNVVRYLLDNELSVFSHKNNGEGIMTDYSFHQHNSFFYDGSYGNVFCTGVNKILGYLEDTSFSVSERALNTYADYILEGHSWYFKKSQSDFSCFGRAISRKNAVGSSIRNDSNNAVNVLVKQKGVDRRIDLLNLQAKRFDGVDNQTEKAKHFYISDMTVIHRPDFYIGVRTSSKRNINTEYMNGENSKAMFISDGVTTIMRTGNEYKNIFPVWDWSMIPGTTTEYISNVPVMSSTYQWGLGEFVGGLSDGRDAISVMDYKRRTATAKKSYFLFDRGMVALGAGITDSAASVRTTVNQCIQNGNVTYFDGTEKTLYTGNSVSADKISWIMHDNIGYYFPDGERLTVSAKNRSGSWKTINSSQASGTVSSNIFTIYKDHGTKPVYDTYSYTVLPSVTKTELTEYIKAPQIDIISNTAAVQAIWNNKTNSASIVFWNKGIPNYKESVTIPGNVTGMDDLTVEALRDPCVVKLNKTDYGYDMYICNPKNNTLKETYIGINRHLEGENTSWDGEKTTITVTFPQGLTAGSTVIIPLTEIS